MTTSRSEISIWFFIGVSLLVNGVLIAGAGIWEFVQPPENPVVLYHLHASLWWGLVLLVVGAVYCVKFKPGRESRATKKSDALKEELQVR